MDQVGDNNPLINSIDTLNAPGGHFRQKTVQYHIHNSLNVTLSSTSRKPIKSALSQLLSSTPWPPETLDERKRLGVLEGLYVVGECELEELEEEELGKELQLEGEEGKFDEPSKEERRQIEQWLQYLWLGQERSTKRLGVERTDRSKPLPTRNMPLSDHSGSPMAMSPPHSIGSPMQVSSLASSFRGSPMVISSLHSTRNLTVSSEQFSFEL